MFDNIYYKFENVFSESQLATIEEVIKSQPESNKLKQEEHGRLCISWFELPQEVIKTVSELVHSAESPFLQIEPTPLFVEYNPKYGTPNLTPHMDGDDNDFIFDFQLKSNTSWGIGLNKSVHDMTDNSAIAFNPNTNIHWRPIKNFNDGEFVQMIFLRFAYMDISQNPTRKPIRRGRDDPIYDEVKDFRENLR